MRFHGQKVVQALNHIPVESVIALLEKGIEVEKLESLVTTDRLTHERIKDGEMFLTFLHFRNIRDLGE